VLPLDAKAPARAGATQTSRYFDHRHHSRSPKGAQHTIAVLVEAAVARRFVAPEDRVSIVENATAFAEAVEVRAESMVPRRVRRGVAWRQARIAAAQVAVDFELTRRGLTEATPLSASPTAVENQAHALVRFFFANLDLDDPADLVVQLAAVLVVLVALTFTTTPATCRGSARRRRRRRRAAATCVRARAARKGAGRDGRPLAPSRMG
jgi:hypothetical protein